jgi:hypothetical protein
MSLVCHLIFYDSIDDYFIMSGDYFFQTSTRTWYLNGPARIARDEKRSGRLMMEGCAWREKKGAKEYR